MKEMTPQQAFDAWKAGDVSIVDVREQDEYDAAHVDGMPLVPLSEIGDRIGDFPTDKTLVLMCRSGKRSAKAAEILTGEGVTDVANLVGGIMAWAEDGLPIVGDPPK